MTFEGEAEKGWNDLLVAHLGPAGATLVWLAPCWGWAGIRSLRGSAWLRFSAIAFAWITRLR